MSLENISIKKNAEELIGKLIVRHERTLGFWPNDVVTRKKVIKRATSKTGKTAA